MEWKVKAMVVLRLDRLTRSIKMEDLDLDLPHVVWGAGGLRKF